MTIPPPPLTEAYPFTAETAVTITGEETLLLTVEEKDQLLLAWQHLMLSGFKNLCLTGPLYRFLIHHCHFSAHHNRAQFWNVYMNASLARFRRFLAQFGGDRRSAEQGNHLWLGGAAADLKEAMCQEAARLYAPLSQVLHDLEMQYDEMIAVWHDFALAANMPAGPLPPAYQLSENTRNLLAYAATIALRYPRPLTGLQLRFPWHQPPLLAAGPVDPNAVVIIQANHQAEVSR